MQRPSPHAYSLPTVKTPNQSHFLTFSNHFRPAWEACPNLPREPYYMSNINKSFHTLLVYVWHHQFQHRNQLLGGNPFCFRRGATTSVLLICSSLIPSFSLTEMEALIFYHHCGAQRDAWSQGSVNTKWMKKWFWRHLSGATPVHPRLSGKFKRCDY